MIFYLMLYNNIIYKAERKKTGIFSGFFNRFTEYLQNYISVRTKMDLILRRRLRKFSCILQCQIPNVTAYLKL